MFKNQQNIRSGKRQAPGGMAFAAPIIGRRRTFAGTLKSRDEQAYTEVALDSPQTS